MINEIYKLLEEEIKKANKTKMEYLEVGRNKLAEKYENKEMLLEEIYSLVKDGEKYRKQKEKENE